MARWGVTDKATHTRHAQEDRRGQSFNHHRYHYYYCLVTDTDVVWLAAACGGSGRSTTTCTLLLRRSLREQHDVRRRCHPTSSNEQLCHRFHPITDLFAECFDLSVSECRQDGQMDGWMGVMRGGRTDRLTGWPLVDRHRHTHTHRLTLSTDLPDSPADGPYACPACGLA